MFSQTRLFYLTAKVVHRSKRRQDGGRIKRGVCVDFLPSTLTGKSVIIVTVKENHSITICTAGWMGELGFSKGNKEYKEQRRSKIFPSVMNQ